MMAEIENCLYDMDCRPNTKMLEKSITDLFCKEYSDEKNKSIEILKYTLDEEQTNPKVAIANQNYQKTRVMSNKTDDKDIKIKNDIIDYSKKIFFGNKKWVILVSVLIILTFIGLILIKSKETKQAKQPVLSIDFIKKLPQKIIDDIKDSQKADRNHTPRRKEPNR